MNGIHRVSNVVRHVRNAPVARGELVLDRQFAQKFITWQARGQKPDLHCDADLLIACCRALGLDLICLHAAQIADREAGPSMGPGDISRFCDEGLFVFWVVDGVFQRAAQRLGLMEMLTAIAQSPEALNKELARISGRVTACMLQGVAAGAHGIIIADDIAYQQSTFMSPDFIGQSLMPLWQAQVKQAAELNVPVFFHSDGNLNQALPHIVAAGFDGLQCIESAAGMDVRQISAKYGRSLCLMGALEPSLLCQPDSRTDMQTARLDLRREIADLMTFGAGSGGFIFGTCSGLHAGMSPELVRFAYRLASDFESERAMSSGPDRR